MKVGFEIKGRSSFSQKEGNMHLQFILRMFRTSVGRKVLMALSGLALAGFMLIHLAENMLLFKGESFYNGWVDFLLSNPITIYLEIGLLLLFMLHIIMGVWVRYEDWINSRGRKYEKINWQGGRTIGSATMLYSAIALLIYLGYHMLTFRFVDHSIGFYQMVTTAFRDKIFVVIYVGGAFALFLHLSHGFQSAFQTLGLNHEKYNFYIKVLGYIVSTLMLLFAFISVFYLFNLDLKFMPKESQVLEKIID